MSERSSNITMKLKYIIIIPIYSFTHCLIKTATALLELLTDCSIDCLWHVPPMPPPTNLPLI